MVLLGKNLVIPGDSLISSRAKLKLLKYTSSQCRLLQAAVARIMGPIISINEYRFATEYLRAGTFDLAMAKLGKGGTIRVLLGKVHRI